MDAETASRLLNLNCKFYQTFAFQFSESRGRIQPGVKRVLETLNLSARILDLGCGNGELVNALARKGFHGRYIGIDYSAELLAEARKKVPKETQATLIHADLGSPDWDKSIPRLKYDLVLAFAVLHHLPGIPLRRQVLDKVSALIDPNGRFIHSEWQFLNSPRLRARIQSWDKVGIRERDVDPGDYLLDWRRGGYGLRYVHHFSEEELESLADETGFQVVERFYSDGETGDLGLYQIWRPA